MMSKRMFYVTKEFEDFVKRMENNISKNLNLSEDTRSTLKLKSIIQRRMVNIFNENPNMVKRLIQGKK